MAKAAAGLTASSMVRLGLIGLLAIGIGWLSLTAYLPRIDSRLTLGAERPADIFTAAGREIVPKQGKLDEQTYRRVAAALGGDPLASEPFLLFGFRALALGDLASAERMLAESRNRNPRNETARIALMAVYLRTGRIREGSEEVATLVRLVPRARELLAPELARLATAPASRQAVVDAIGDEPIMAEVLGHLVRQNADPDLVIALAARQPRATGGRFAPWQQQLLKQLTERGDETRAYALWRGFVGSSANELIYDAGFTGQPGPPPFNWELTASDVGAAERGRTGGLDIEYFGRKSGPLARQLLLLRPGRYRLEFQAEGNASGQGSRILVQVACRGAESKLLEITLRGLALAPKSASGEFSVSAGCGAQWLTFAGQAAEFPNIQRARITALALRPAG